MGLISDSEHFGNISPAIHSANVSRYLAVDPNSGEPIRDDAISALSAALDTARGEAERIDGLESALRADPTRTQAAADVELRLAALKAGERAAKAIDAARERTLAVVRQVEAETGGPPPPKDAGALQLEGEVRAAFARMNASDRRVAINRALEEGDDVTIGALLRGPAFLAGMEKGEQDNLRARFRLKRFPDQAARLERLRKALEATDRGALATVRFVEKKAAPAAEAAAQADATAARLAAVG